MARDKVISSWQNSPGLVSRRYFLRQWCCNWQLDPSVLRHISTDVKEICAASSVSPAGVFRVVHAVWSCRKQGSQRLCYFNGIQNYLCIMKSAVKQSCVRTWSAPMSSSPGIHTERKKAMHFLQSNPRNSVAVWVSAVTRIWGFW